MSKSVCLNIARKRSSTQEFADRVINSKQVDLLLVRASIKGFPTEQDVLEFLEFQCDIDVVSLEQLTNIQLDAAIRKLNSL